MSLKYSEVVQLVFLIVMSFIAYWAWFGEVKMGLFVIFVVIVLLTYYVVMKLIRETVHYAVNSTNDKSP